MSFDVKIKKNLDNIISGPYRTFKKCSSWPQCMTWFNKGSLHYERLLYSDWPDGQSDGPVCCDHRKWTVH